MSRPIYEPSLQRTDARLGYTSNQLLRRPAPASEAGGCGPWIRIGQGSHTYGFSVQRLLVSPILQYDPALVTEDVDYSWTTETVDGTDDTWVVSSRKQGWYMWDALLIVDIAGSISASAGGIETWLTTTAANELSPYYEAWDIFDDNTFTSGWQGEGAFHVHWAGFVHISSTNREWRFAVRQGTDGNLDIGVEWITIWRLCEDDALTWTELNVND